MGSISTLLSNLAKTIDERKDTLLQRALSDRPIPFELQQTMTREFSLLRLLNIHVDRMQDASSGYRFKALKEAFGLLRQVSFGSSSFQVEIPEIAYQFYDNEAHNYQDLSQFELYRGTFLKDSPIPIDPSFFQLSNSEEIMAVFKGIVGEIFQIFHQTQLEAVKKITSILSRSDIFSKNASHYLQKVEALSCLLGEHYIETGSFGKVELCNILSDEQRERVVREVLTSLKSKTEPDRGGRSSLQPGGAMRR